MSAREFRDDDAGYRTWLARHPEGYVLNIARSYNTADARVHHAGCWTINGHNPRTGAWTETYVKICAEHPAQLEQWAGDRGREPVPACRICHSTHQTVRPTPTQQSARAAADPMAGCRHHVRGPEDGSATVEAWADSYIRFADRRPCQRELRSEIHARCRQLDPTGGQVLHATFFGHKPDRTDVENLVLYNIDSFAFAGRNGIRFEHGVSVPPAPDDAQYPFCYRYALAPRSGAFTEWQPRRTLASFGWTALTKGPAQVWLALVRNQLVDVAIPPCAPQTPFAVKVKLRPPRGDLPRVKAALVKEIFDGLICAFQAHTDTTGLPEVVARLARILSADPVEIQDRLLDRSRAVLGVVPRLVFVRDTGVQWNPGDDWCVAGELLAVEPVDSRWAISGELVELSRRHSVAVAR